MRPGEPKFEISSFGRQKINAAIRSRRNTIIHSPPKKMGMNQKIQISASRIDDFYHGFQLYFNSTKEKKNELSSKKARPAPLANSATTCENPRMFHKGGKHRSSGVTGITVASLHFVSLLFRQFLLKRRWFPPFSRLGRGKVGGIPATRCSWDVSPNSPNSPPTS